MAPAGRYDRRVSLQAPAGTADGAGGFAGPLWRDVVTVWGAFRPEAGHERVSAGRIESPAAGVLRVRSSNLVRDVTAGWRVLIDGEAYDMHSVIDRGRRAREKEMTVGRSGAD